MKTMGNHMKTTLSMWALTLVLVLLSACNVNFSALFVARRRALRTDFVDAAGFATPSEVARLATTSGHVHMQIFPQE